MYEKGNGNEIRFHKVEPMLGEWDAHGQPTVMFLGLLKSVPVLRELEKKSSMCGVYEIVEINGLSCVEIIA